jgi:hypothetical protein
MRAESLVRGGQGRPGITVRRDALLAFAALSLAVWVLIVAGVINAAS